MPHCSGEPCGGNLAPTTSTAATLAADNNRSQDVAGRKQGWYWHGKCYKQTIENVITVDCDVEMVNLVVADWLGFRHGLSIDTR